MKIGNLHRPPEGLKNLGRSGGQEYLQSFTNAVVWNAEVTMAGLVSVMVQVLRRE